MPASLSPDSPAHAATAPVGPVRVRQAVRRGERAPGAGTSDQSPSVPDIVFRKSVLPSGLRIVSERVPAARSVAVGVWVDIGSRDESPRENGITHFIEHMVFKGTRRRKTHHIAHYLESVGGYLNAFTGKDSTCYYARLLGRHLDRAVDILSDIVLRPSFQAQEIEKEKQVILDEMRGIEEDPEDIINDHFDRGLFGAHPLGNPVIGIAENVTSFSRTALLDYLGRRYTAPNIVISAAGDVEHERLAALCERAFRHLPAGEGIRRSRPPRRAPRDETIAMSSQQTHQIIGCRTDGSRGRDAHALSLLSALLGDGMSSRLFQRVRERHGIAYNIYSFVSLYHDVGVFGIYFGTDAGKAGRSRNLILSELDRIRAVPVSSRELHRAAEQVIGGLVIGMESMSTRMNRLGRDELVFGRDVPLDETIGQLRAVTPDDIRALAEKVCDRARLSFMTIEPR